MKATSLTLAMLLLAAAAGGGCCHPYVWRGDDACAMPPLSGRHHQPPIAGGYADCGGCGHCDACAAPAPCGSCSGGPVGGHCSTCPETPGYPGYHGTLTSYLGKHLTCGSGCGEFYFDEWVNDPPHCQDPCDNCGNFAPFTCGPPGAGDGLLAHFFGYQGGHCGHEGCGPGGCGGPGYGAPVHGGPMHGGPVHEGPIYGEPLAGGCESCQHGGYVRESTEGGPWEGIMTPESAPAESQPVYGRRVSPGRVAAKSHGGKSASGVKQRSSYHYASGRSRRGQPTPAKRPR